MTSSVPFESTRTRWASRLRDYSVIGVIAAIVAGAVLRFAAVAWGLPDTWNPDELTVIAKVIEMSAADTFEPNFYARPDHLEIKLSYLAYEVYARLFYGLGTAPETLFAIDQTPFFIISRSITAVFGVGSILIAALIGRRFHPRIGLFAAVVFALYPVYVQHSQMMTPDVPLCFTVLLLMYAGMRYLERETWGALVLACVAVALGITIKYPAAIGTLVIALVVVVAAARSRTWLRILTRGAAAIGMVVAFVFILAPNLLTNASAVREAIATESRSYHLGASGLGFSGRLQYYVDDLVSTAGYLIAIFAIIGIVWLVRQRKVEAIVFLISPAYWVAMSMLPLHWARWGLPMYLAVLLLAAVGGHAALELAARLRRRRIALAAVGVLFGISTASMLVSSVVGNLHRMAPSTTTIALADLETEGISTEDTAYDGYSPFWPNGFYTIDGILNVDDGVVVADPDPDPQFLPVPMPDDIDYVLTSANIVSRSIGGSATPELRELYTAVQELPVVDQWVAIGAPPSSAWEIERLINSVPYVIELVNGASTGSTITLYRLEQ